jgi:myo-inositol-1(or 4)-monophosphatase
VARRAGELQLSRYQDPGEVKEKAPKDFVTEVDLLCEELMVNAIGDRYPDDAILSVRVHGCFCSFKNTLQISYLLK